MVNRQGSRVSLEAAVFICGASTMILELTGSRVMAPHIGTSLYVWTSLIGVILAFLSLGYWLGGRMADRDARPAVLARVIFLAALWVALTAAFYDMALSLLRLAIGDLRLAAVVASILLFATPATLLGIVLPYAVKLKIHSVGDAGRTVGGLYALSTFGSIAGTFLAGFVLLACLKNSIIFLVLAALLFTSSILVSRASLRPKVLTIIAALSFLGTSEFFTAKVYGSDFIDANTAYNRIWIYERPAGQEIAQVMQINDEFSSVRWIEKEGLFSVYARYFRLSNHFVPGLKSALMLGGAGYVYPMDFLEKNPEATMDVVEIDPDVTRLAREHFGLKLDPRLRIYHEDARTFLNRNTETYDVIFGDAFKSFSVPFHLTTLEMIKKVHASLSDGGAFMMNVISSVEGDTGQFLRAELATLKQVFPQVYVFPVSFPEDGNKVQNILVVALKSGDELLFSSKHRIMNEYLGRRWTKPIAETEPVLEDDFAPVEFYQAPLFNRIESRKESPLLQRWKRALRIRVSSPPVP